MKKEISNFSRGKKLCAGLLLTGTLLAAHNAIAVECRLSIVLDRTGSMGVGSDPLSKCSIARDFTIGVVQGLINGDDVGIIPGTPTDPTVPVIDVDFYTNQCLPSERRVEIITVSEAAGFPDDPVSFTSGFVDPAVAMAQLLALEATDNAATSSCNGSTQFADSLCVAADSLRSAAPNFNEVRKMKIVTDGGENSSHLDVPTNCDASVPIGDPAFESSWISNSTTELLLGGVAIQFDSILFTDLFFSSAASGGGGNPPNEVSSSGKLSTAEQNFLATIALNTGGSVNLLEKPADVAGSFTSPDGGGIDLCDSDLDQDFDVDNLDAFRFSLDFNNPSCQISP